MIKKVVLKNFRNHKHIEINIKKAFVYIDGPNGSGKTSILESIYFCATTKSHRTSDENELIMRGEPFTFVGVETKDNQFELIYSKTGKRASINKIEKRKISDYIGNLKAVMFSAQDISLINGSPGNRRQFLDLEWMQIDKSYLHQLNKYKKILKQRNSLLKRIKQSDDYTFLDILGDQLLIIGCEIIDQRNDFINNLNNHLGQTYKLFSNNEVKMIYKPNSNQKSLSKHLKTQQKQDILYQTTLVGPHRDDFSIEFNGFDAKSYSSQGEQRLIVVALKLALLKLIEEKTKEQAILLLDDVLSELDTEKQKLFIDNLPTKHQIIMNSAFPVKGEHMQMIHLKKGAKNVKL